MKLIRNFKQLTKNDVDIAGGKGASLGEMTQAGIPVPPGFVILSPAFEQFIKETDLIQEIDAILDKVNHEDICTVENASEKIRGLILDAEIPGDIKKEIGKEFKKLGAKYVAVRSSATAEDGQEHAWAGQLDSFLNTKEENLFENIKKCWASLFTPRAIFYRFEKGLHSTKISVAVVVQKMVESEISGIAFSVHPITENRNQLIIEAGFGLGEAIVSGQITPNSYVVEKEPRQILDVNVNTQTKGLYRANSPAGEGGNEWRNIPEPKASSQVLSGKHILDLSELILKIEDHYGFPCDIEWAFEDGKFYIVQSRPITTLSEKTETSHLPKINSAEFWARERSIPLCYLTNTKNNMDASNIVFYKKDMFHLYYINDSQKKNEEAGNKFFSRKGSVSLYKKETNKTTRDIKIIFDKYNKFDLGKLKSEELKDLYLTLSQKITESTNLYKKTEASNTHKLNELKLDLNKIAKIRLELRKPLLDLFYIFIAKLISEIARRNNSRVVKDLFFYKFDEIIDLIMAGKRIEEKELKERRKGFAVLIEGMNVKFFYKKDANILWRKIHKLLAPKNKNEINGSTAYGKGKVRGIAKVLFQSRNKKLKGSDFGVKEGDIVVTDMTKPDMMAAYREASGIITDEGGIVCHASIISRELKKPCIVGTKIATQFIKTGDTIEMNLDNGEVKKIKKYSLK